MTEYIIAVSVTTVSERAVESRRQNHNGSWLDIRKNPHVIDVGLEPSLQLSCWCIMRMVIYTIQGLEI
jgi:hypothetical protein